MKKSLLLAITGFLIFSLFFTNTVQAQSTGEEPEKIDDKVYEDAGVVSDTVNENTTGAQNVEKSAAKSILGHSMSLLQGACTTCFKNSEKLPEHLQHGLLENVDRGIIAMFNSQPKVDVIAHLANEWVPGYKDTNTVYAGGYEDLQSAKIDDLWSITRNIAYVGYVVIMIAIGFMIMFRNKIGGQVMVTVGNSLPKVVLSLVLVTFSFYIIGLIIDVGGILKNVIANIYYPSNSDLAIEIHNPFILLGNFLMKSPASLISSSLGVGGIILTIITLSPVAILVGIIGLLVAGIILVGGIKLWIVLVKAYLGILVDVIISPFTIMIGALPGNESSMFNSLKSAARNVLVFPIAFAIVNLPYVLEGRGVSLAFPETLTGASSTGSPNLASLLISVAKIIAIFAAASAPDIAKSIIPPTAPKSGVDTSRNMKENLSKIPLLGGMFK